MTTAYWTTTLNYVWNWGGIFGSYPKKNIISKQKSKQDSLFPSTALRPGELLQSGDVLHLSHGTCVGSSTQAQWPLDISVR